jgi:hypothetical protein
MKMTKTLVETFRGMTAEIGALMDRRFALIGGRQPVPSDLDAQIAALIKQRQDKWDAIDSATKDDVEAEMCAA